MILKGENAVVHVSSFEFNLCFDEQSKVMSTGLFNKEKASTPLVPKPVVCPVSKFGCALPHCSLMNDDFEIPAKVRANGGQCFTSGLVT